MKWWMRRGSFLRCALLRTPHFFSPSANCPGGSDFLIFAPFSIRPPAFDATVAKFESDIFGAASSQIA